MTILDGDGSFGEVVNVTGSSPMTIEDMTIRNGGDGVDAFQQGVTPGSDPESGRDPGQRGQRVLGR
jgi:hypothetical protein